MQSNRDSGEITRLLQAWQGGHGEALNELWPILYGELKRRAEPAPARSGNRGVRDLRLRFAAPPGYPPGRFRLTTARPEEFAPPALKPQGGFYARECPP